jgi:hypothetical protein
MKNQLFSPSKYGDFKTFFQIQFLWISYSPFFFVTKWQKSTIKKPRSQQLGSTKVIPIKDLKNKESYETSIHNRYIIIDEWADNFSSYSSVLTN